MGSGNTDIVSRKARWIASRLILHPISLKSKGVIKVMPGGGSAVRSPALGMLAHVHQKPGSQPWISYPLRQLLVRRLSCRRDAQALIKSDRLQTVEEVLHVPLTA